MKNDLENKSDLNNDTNFFELKENSLKFSKNFS